MLFYCILVLLDL